MGKKKKNKSKPKQEKIVYSDIKPGKKKKLTKPDYEDNLRKLQIELVKLQK